MLEDRIELGTQRLPVRDGGTFMISLTEETGGNINLLIEEPDHPGHYLAVSCDAARARDIAAGLIELAEVVESNG